MKRIQSACICQTLHFQLKDGEEHAYAARKVREEVELYKKSLERGRALYRILEETIQPDDSIVIKIVKQYNQSPVGDYLESV